MSNEGSLQFDSAKFLKITADRYNLQAAYYEEKFKDLQKFTNEGLDDFLIYLFDVLHDMARIGCSSWEYETDINFNEVCPELFNTLKELGFKYNFYELKDNPGNYKYCLYIDWDVENE